MYGLDTIRLYAKCPAAEANAEKLSDAKEMFTVEKGTVTTRKIVGTLGEIRVTFRAPDALTAEVSIPKLINPDNNLVCTPEDQTEALRRLDERWRALSDGMAPRVSRLDAALDVAWPASNWPLLHNQLSTLAAPRMQPTVRNEIVSWDQRNRRLKVYRKTLDVVRLESTTGRSKAVARTLKGEALKGLTLDELTKHQHEIARLILTKASLDIGIFAMKESETHLLQKLLRLKSPGTAFRLIGYFHAANTLGEEQLKAIVPKTTYYRMRQEAREHGVLDEQARSFADILWRELAPGRPLPDEIKSEWEKACKALALRIQHARHG